MKKTSIIAALALGLTTVGLTATAGNAAFVTRCVGQGGAVTIPGDLVVPAGQTCWLDGTTVQGNVRVAQGADLIVLNGTFNGQVNVQRDAYFDASGTTVGGAVVARESFGNLVSESIVGGAVSSISNEAEFGFLIVRDSSLGAQVRATGASLDLESSGVATNVVALQADYADIHDTVIEGNLRVEGNPGGSVVCDSEVYGNVNLSGNSTAVQIGGDRGDGGLVDCEGSNYFGTNVNVNNNQGGVWMYGNIVRGNLAGNGNDPAPVGDGNRVRGESRGQFATMATASMSMSMSKAAETDRLEEHLQAAKDRLARAEQKAEAAGSAF